MMDTRTIRIDRRATSRRGGALLMAVIFVTLVAALTAAVLQISNSVTKRQVQDTDQLRAFYLAEAGLGEAFLGLRMGKPGQIGSAASPAVYGDGLLWVDAEETAEDQVRLESTAICGRGTSTLALVVERVEEPVGIFSEDDLHLTQALLVDGFDSEEGTYQDQVQDGKITIDRSYPYLNVDGSNNLLFYAGSFYHFLSAEGDTFLYDHSVSVQALSEIEFYATECDIQADDFTDDDHAADFEDVEYKGVLHYFGGLSSGAGTGDPGATPSGSLPGGDGPTTGGGGLVGSNGVITVGGSGDAVGIFGDVRPGPGQQVTVGSGGAVSGSTQARDTALELPAVEVPAVALLSAVQHADAVPMLISPGTIGYESIEVAADAELVIRGPATVVLGTLTLAEGASLSLDTAGGDVELFITSGVNLAPGSTVTTSSERAEELSLQVDAIETVLGEAPVQLRADSQFYGTIYAPDADVAVGAGFEVYGALVAKSLELEPGVRLHYDEQAAEAVPRVVSWRITQSPAAANELLLDPFGTLGLTKADLSPLAAAVSVDGVHLEIKYEDSAGSTLTYTGPEQDFDWSNVAKVLDVKRDGKAGTVEPSDDASGAVSPADQSLIDRINSDPPSELAAALLDGSPLSECVLRALIEAGGGSLSGAWLTDVLLANSPLPPVILEAVITNEPVLLSDPLRNDVLLAQ